MKMSDIDPMKAWRKAVYLSHTGRRTVAPGPRPRVIRGASKALWGGNGADDRGLTGDPTPQAVRPAARRRMAEGHSRGEASSGRGHPCIRRHLRVHEDDGALGPDGDGR